MSASGACLRTAARIAGSCSSIFRIPACSSFRNSSSSSASESAPTSRFRSLRTSSSADVSPVDDRFVILAKQRRHIQRQLDELFGQQADRRSEQVVCADADRHHVGAVQQRCAAVSEKTKQFAAGQAVDRRSWHIPHRMFSASCRAAARDRPVSPDRPTRSRAQWNLPVLRIVGWDAPQTFPAGSVSLPAEESSAKPPGVQAASRHTRKSRMQKIRFISYISS